MAHLPNAAGFLANNPIMRGLSTLTNVSVPFNLSAAPQAIKNFAASATSIEIFDADHLTQYRDVAFAFVGNVEVQRAHLWQPAIVLIKGVLVSFASAVTTICGEAYDASEVIGDHASEMTAVDILAAAVSPALIFLMVYLAVYALGRRNAVVVFIGLALVFFQHI